MSIINRRKINKFFITIIKSYGITGKTGKQDESNNKSVINDWGKGGKVVGLNKIKK